MTRSCECGHLASGQYCSECGSKLRGDGGGPPWLAEALEFIRRPVALATAYAKTLWLASVAPEALERRGPGTLPSLAFLGVTVALVGSAYKLVWPGDPLSFVLPEWFRATVKALGVVGIGLPAVAFAWLAGFIVVPYAVFRATRSRVTFSGLVAFSVYQFAGPSLLLIAPVLVLVWARPRSASLVGMLELLALGIVSVVHIRRMARFAGRPWRMTTIVLLGAGVINAYVLPRPSAETVRISGHWRLTRSSSSTRGVPPPRRCGAETSSYSKRRWACRWEAQRLSGSSGSWPCLETASP